MANSPSPKYLGDISGVCYCNMILSQQLLPAVHLVSCNKTIISGRLEGTGKYSTQNYEHALLLHVKMKFSAICR